MRRTIGVVTTDHVAMGVVEGHRAGPLHYYPSESSDTDALQGMPAEDLARLIRDQVEALTRVQPVAAIGVAFPGIVRGEIIEESPNLHQLKGLNVRKSIGEGLKEKGIEAPVVASNDADVVAAGIAATRGQLDRLIRVWTLGAGIGFGRHPVADGVWEGGHTVVTLDPTERYCGCGGLGHLEGIMGHRAMRLRFLDMEPEEVFEAAKSGDPRCREFMQLWHRALAAATASAIHMDGPGKFYITGPNSRFLNLPVFNRLVQEMVKMSPLQGYVFEVVPEGDEIAVIGAAVIAERAAFPSRAAG